MSKIYQLDLSKGVVLCLWVE